MDFWEKYKSALGYQIGDDGIDTYGVDHNGFTPRDEVSYQTARNERENQLIENYNKQGITENYPEAGNEFWGNSAENNHGFGKSDINGNIIFYNTSSFRRFSPFIIVKLSIFILYSADDKSYCSVS